TVGRARRLFRRGDRGRVGIVGFVSIIGRLVIGLCRRRRSIGLCGCVGLGGLLRFAGLARILLVSLLVGRLVGLFRHGVAHRDTIVDAEHHHDGVGLFRRENLLGRRSPVCRIALGLILDQT